MKRQLTATFVCLLLATTGVPSPAAADERAEQIGREARAQIDYPVEDLGWTVHFLPGRPGYLGLAIGEERRINIYVRPEHGVFDVAHTLAHETGHAVDITYGTDYRRTEYLRMRGFDPKRKWFGCDACTDYATPAGDFAEVFEYWLLGGGDYRSQLGAPPGPDQLRLLSTLFVEPPQPSVRVFWRQRWTPA